MTLAKKILSHKIALGVFRIIIGMIFLYASLDKIAHVSDFSRVIHNYRIVPISLENIMAISLPWMEFIAGLFLIIGYRVRGSALLISFLLMVFTIALTSALARNLDISCGCFDTKEGTKIGFHLLVRDIVLLAMSASIAFAPTGEREKSY